MFRAGAVVEAVIIAPPRYGATFVTFYGAPAAEIVETVTRVWGRPAGELALERRPIGGQVELREDVPVGRGMLVAVLDGVEDPGALAEALRKLAAEGR